MALELIKDGVRANVISPGGFDTPMNDGIRIPEDANMKLIVSRTSVETGMGQPDDAANLVVFLSSDEARYINGADIMIDGGAHSSM